MSSNVLQVDRVSFQQEQDKLLKTILDARFFNGWSRRRPTEPNDVPVANLELFITSACNQKCEYCYLVKHPELYPAEVNNRETIIANLKRLLDWIIENDYHIPVLDMFTGEIWHSKFGLEILDIVYDYVVNKNLHINGIMIPSNCSFLHDPKQTSEIQNRINDFRKVGVMFRFSISIDGKPIEDEMRPLNDGTVYKKDDEFYERVFSFAKFNDFGFHPMVAAASIDKWIDNYKWWKMMLKKYNLPMDYLMMLEVRNDDWTDKNMDDLEKFIEFLVDEVVVYHDGNMNMIVDDLLGINQTYVIDESDMVWGHQTSYTPFTFGDDRGFYGCSISTHMTVRLGDLAIIPCHRTAYHKQVYGYFKVEDGKIVDITANNPHLAIHIIMTDKRFGVIGCDTCTFQGICFGCCRGQSREATGDPIHNDPKVCKFLKRKYGAMFDVYERKGIMQWLEENLTEYHTSYTSLKVILDVYHRYKEAKEHERLEAHRQNVYW